MSFYLSPTDEVLCQISVNTALEKRDVMNSAGAEGLTEVNFRVDLAHCLREST